jgi:hypothetical protein
VLTNFSGVTGVTGVIGVTGVTGVMGVMGVTGVTGVIAKGLTSETTSFDTSLFLTRGDVTLDSISLVASDVTPAFINGESAFSVLSVGNFSCKVLSAIDSFTGGKNLFVSGS